MRRENGAKKGQRQKVLVPQVTSLHCLRLPLLGFLFLLSSFYFPSFVEGLERQKRVSLRGSVRENEDTFSLLLFLLPCVLCGSELLFLFLILLLLIKGRERRKRRG